MARLENLAYIAHATRIALILAVSRRMVGGDFQASRIEACDAEFATKLVGYLVGDVIRVVRENVSESADEKAKKRMLQIIAHAGPKGVLKGELTRKTQWVRRAFRDEYLADLVESGEIVERSEKGGALRYVVREYLPQ